MLVYFLGYIYLYGYAVKAMNTHTRFPLVEVPLDVQTVLYLLREELKSRRLFRALQEAGLDGSYFQPRLDELILRNLALDDSSDEVFDAYYKIMERGSRKIQPDNDSVMKQAFKVYHELLNEKKRLALKKKHNVA